MYWEDRVRQETQDYYRMSINAQEEALRAIYVDQSEKLYNQIVKVYLKIMEDSSTKGYVYINDLYRTNTYHLFLNYFNKCAKKIGGAQVAITEKALLDMYNFAQKTITKNIPKNATQAIFVVPQAVKPQQVIRQAWCADGKNFSDRIWLSKQKLQEQLMTTLSDSVMRGESPYKMGKHLMERLDVDRSSALRIARTETAHAQISGQVRKYKELGFTHGRFNATEPCSDCASLDNQLFTLDELETMIPRHPNCECSFKLELQEVNNGN